MIIRRPLSIGSDLIVGLAGRRVQLTPRQGLAASEQLIRASVFRMATEEFERARPRAKKRSKRGPKK